MASNQKAMTIIDRVIEIWNPKLALERHRSRNVLVAERQFDAAGYGRRFSNWGRSQATPANEVSPALVNLRQRARWIAQNNPWAGTASEVVARHTVGRGIRAGIKNKTMNQAWGEWAESTKCDYYGRTNIYGLQRLIMETVSKSGECIVVKHFGGTGPKLQVLEGDYLDSGKRILQSKEGGNFTVDGIEFDAQGNRVAYWIFQSNPLQFMLPSQRVPADQVLHIFKPIRPGQHRGIPFGVSVLMRIQDFDEYEEAQLLKAKMAACFSIWVTDMNGGQLNTKQVLPDRIEPGMIFPLNAGQSIAVASPASTDGYERYSRNQLLAIAQGFGISYEALTGDYSNVNFSSAKMGQLEFAKNVQFWQEQLMIPLFCQPVYEWFQQWSQFVGRKSWNTPATWTPPKREMIDPTKEIAALRDQIRSGLISWPEAVRQLGYDPDEMLEEIQRINAAMDEKGIKLDCDSRYFPTPASGMVDPNAETAADKKDAKP